MILWTALFLWIGALCWFFYIRLHLTVGRLRRHISFRPRGAFDPRQLFACLLSGSLAVLEQDDFNQLESSLSSRRTRDLLATCWGIESRKHWLNAIESRLRDLGKVSPAERALIDQWRPDALFDTEGLNPLQDVCTFLSSEACVIGGREIHARHLSPMAWDIQQAAYCVRLGLAAGYAPAGFSRIAMDRLQREARRHYASWSDYFLSSLIGMGMRHHVDIFSPGDWHRIAQTYAVLTSSWDCLLRHAPMWSLHDDSASKVAVFDLARSADHGNGDTMTAARFQS